MRILKQQNDHLPFPWIRSGFRVNIFNCGHRANLTAGKTPNRSVPETLGSGGVRGPSNVTERRAATSERGPDAKYRRKGRNKRRTRNMDDPELGMSFVAEKLVKLFVVMKTKKKKTKFRYIYVIIF